MSRIARVNRRRRLASQAALGAFVAVVATYGGVQMITATPAGSQRHLVEQDPAEAPPTAEVPTPTAKPKPKPKPEQPAPKPTVAPEKPEPTAPPVKQEPKDDPTYVPKPEPKPTYTKKEPVPGGLSVELFPYDTAKAGSQMSWKVTAYDPSGRLMSIVVHFGDGTSASYAPDEPCGADVNVRRLFPHTYAKAGTYAAKAVVTTGGCGAATETETVHASVKVLEAGAGNGPAAPTVSAEQVEAAVAKLALHGGDADGWVKKFYVDWGDGTESYAGPRPFDGCQEGKPSSWDTSASHEYAGPGTYTVKVTVLSTDCSGGDGQTSTFTLTITV